MSTTSSIMFELPSVVDRPSANKGKRYKENVVTFETEASEASYGASSSLSNSFLEKNLQSALTPMHIMLVLFFCAKFNIWDHKITPNGAYHTIFSALGTLTILCGCFYFMLGSSFAVFSGGFTYFQYLNKVYVYFLLFVGSFLNFYINLIHKYNNVFVILKVQSIYQILKINEIFKRFVFSNWASVITLNCFHIAWVLYSYYNYELNVVGVGISLMSYCFISFDMTLLYAARVMKLLTKPLERWVKNVKRSGRVANSENECYWNTMFEVYMEILEVYEIFEKTFHQMILFYTVHTTTKSLIAIVIRIEMKKVTTGSEAIFALLSFISLTWIIKNMMLLSFLSVESERFYAAMRDVQSTCIQLANSSRCSDAQKRVCKNIQRVHISSFTKMQACGLFIIDAGLALNVCGLITTYTIIILQFEFL